MGNIKHCVICGKEYEYCPRCKKYEMLPKWYKYNCSDDCHVISETINKYSFGHITADEANNKISKINTVIVNKEISKIIDEIKVATKPVEITKSVDTLDKDKVVDEKPKKIKKKFDLGLSNKIVNED